MISLRFRLSGFSVFVWGDFCMGQGIRRRDTGRRDIRRRDTRRRGTQRPGTRLRRGTLRLRPTRRSTRSRRRRLSGNRVAARAAWRAVWLLYVAAVSWTPAFEDRKASVVQRAKIPSSLSSVQSLQTLGPSRLNSRISIASVAVFNI
ncbi:hypothetical protein EUGRSUZ_I01052 [Eucalyptus grandis]|uniref:Uncharacterized protein n=2 Tax=Eucalyptus grandis TaxID=71139 RepID=A0ACC3JEF5_EUCGR|nr:hypothetical protein EUGRSUZ_I01052 [Eucalyptus grandis]